MVFEFARKHLFFLCLAAFVSDMQLCANDNQLSQLYVSERQYKLCFDKENDSLQKLLDHDKLVINLVTEKVANQALNSSLRTGNEPTTSIDLRTLDANFPPAFNQGKLGSCTANALSALVRYVMDSEKLAIGQPMSRLFIYYNERKIEGNINDDYGASLSTGIYSLCTYGVCFESYSPYQISMFRQKPSAAAYANALNYADLDNMAVDQIEQ
jgi:hypothetical protein